MGVFGAKMAEFAVALLGVRLAEACGVGDFVIKSDCLNVFRNVCSKETETDFLALGMFANMFKSLVSPLPFLGLIHSSRDHNRVSDYLASYALSLCQMMFLFDHMPYYVVSVVIADVSP